MFTISLYLTAIVYVGISTIQCDVVCCSSLRPVMSVIARQIWTMIWSYFLSLQEDRTSMKLRARYPMPDVLPLSLVSKVHRLVTCQDCILATVSCFASAIMVVFFLSSCDPLCYLVVVAHQMPESQVWYTICHSCKTLRFVCVNCNYLSWLLCFIFRHLFPWTFSISTLTYNFPWGCDSFCS